MNDKGRQASWLCPINEIDEKTQNILTPFVKEAIIKVTCEKAADIARKQYHQQKEAKKAAKKNAELAKLGINEVKKIVIDEKNYGGGKKEYKFFFDTPVDEETFKKFLQLEELVVEAKECLHPISPEVVEYYPITGGWKYKWLGEWDD